MPDPYQPGTQEPQGPQEPQVSNQSPQVSNQSPQISNQSPQVSNQSPQISNQSPQGMSSLLLPKKEHCE